MQGHGNHWETLYELDDYVENRLTRDLRSGRLICRAPCIDVEGGTDRVEQATCLRHGSERLANQILIVSNTAKGSNYLYSGYPVALDGIVHAVKIDRIEPWTHGIEAWIHGRAMGQGISLTFFDTMYFSGCDRLHPGQTVNVTLAALAYWLRPIATRSFEIAEGPMWTLERKRRLKEGKSEAEASRPIQIQMTGAAIFLPRGGDTPDDAQIQGVIDNVDRFEEDGQTIYRLEMVVVRSNDEEFRLPVFASEHALAGYVPQLGEDVEGVVWVQGHINA